MIMKNENENDYGHLVTRIALHKKSNPEVNVRYNHDIRRVHSVSCYR